MNQNGYRLLTRSDFDGLVSAVLLQHQDKVREIVFVHPNDMQNGLIEVSDQDISTNLPYVPGILMAFDHHRSETLRNEENPNHVIDPNAPSSARVIWNYFGGDTAFPIEWHDMMEAVDKSDSAQFTREEVLYPENWILLNFIMDARTGLGRFKNFRISNYELMMNLIDACSNLPIEKILELPDVKERTDAYEDQQFKFLRQLDRCSKINRNLVTIDLRNEKTIYVGNRFIVYALNPQCNISMHLAPGRNEDMTMIAVGKSIFDRTSSTDVGSLMLEYGGGGHTAVGTCQVPNAEVETTCARITEIITAEK